jgi:hypothetical protein
VIDFRYHVVSIVAVFLALAIGIVFGSTELQGTTYNVLNRTTAKLQTQLDQARSGQATAQAEASEAEAYAQAVEPAVLRDLLSGQRLLIVTEPGAQSSVVSGIAAAAIDGGATVTGQIALQPKFFDISDTTQDSLNQTTLDVAQPAGISLNTSENYQQQAAQVIATEILAKSSQSAGTQQTGTQQTGTGQPSTGQPSTGQPSTGQPSTGQPTTGLPSTGPSSEAQTMLAAYASAGFLNTTGQPAAQATLVVVVTPQTAPADGSADQLDQVLIPLVEELSAKSSATVVAGSSAGSGPGSPIAVLRSNNAANQVSTVDDADFVFGQSAVIQALATLLGGGKAGSYGFTGNGASAVAPSPAPTAAGSVSPTAPATSPAKNNAAKKNAVKK